MKTKIAIILLAIACIGLGVALYATKKQAEDQHVADVGSINDYSNQLVGASVQIKDLSQANLALTNDLALSRQQSLDLSNSLASASTALAETKTTLLSAQGQITNLNSHINELEVQNKVLDDRANDLTNTISRLSALIEDTSIKLAIAETNREYLSGELTKQMAQKAELEHKFNDINEVRAQVKKLKDEMFIARRMQLMKNDNGGKKGAELLMLHTPLPATNTPAKLPPNYDLNVEVGSDGSVKVIPPIGATNAPAK
jgi:chromosome segregation ATPase